MKFSLGLILLAMVGTAAICRSVSSEFHAVSFMECGAYFRATCCYTKNALWSAHIRKSTSVRPSLTFHRNVGLIQLVTVLILAGDIAVNPGPISVGQINCRSWRNKGPLVMDWINSNHFDTVGLTETHIKPTDTESFSELTLPNYTLWHVPRKYH